MPTRFTTRSLPLTAVPALLALLALAAAAPGGDKRTKEPPAQKAAEKEAQREQGAVKQAMEGQLSEAVKEAYILLAAANGDYAGHRGKAMRHAQDAAKALDRKILEGPNVAHKIKALQEAHAAGNAKILAKYSVPIKEGQAVSDALVFRAGALLKEVQPMLAKTKQRGALRSVEKAVEEVEKALTVR
jgi:hypothetical protein